MKLIHMQRLKVALEAFSDMEISNMFNLPMHKREQAIITLDRLIIEQERNIKWLSMPNNKIRTTPEQDASIERMYESQRKDAERFGLPVFTND